jgi:hypothetical protein
MIKYIEGSAKSDELDVFFFNPKHLPKIEFSKISNANKTEFIPKPLVDVYHQYKEYIEAHPWNPNTMSRQPGNHNDSPIPAKAVSNKKKNPPKPVNVVPKPSKVSHKKKKSDGDQKRPISDGLRAYIEFAQKNRPLIKEWVKDNHIKKRGLTEEQRKLRRKADTLIVRKILAEHWAKRRNFNRKSFKEHIDYYIQWIRDEEIERRENAALLLSRYGVHDNEDAVNTLIRLSNRKSKFSRLTPSMQDKLTEVMTLKLADEPTRAVKKDDHAKAVALVDRFMSQRDALFDEAVAAIERVSSAGCRFSRLTPKMKDELETLGFDINDIEQKLKSKQPKKPKRDSKSPKKSKRDKSSRKSKERVEIPVQAHANKPKKHVEDPEIPDTDEIVATATEQVSQLEKMPVATPAQRQERIAASNGIAEFISTQIAALQTMVKKGKNLAEMSVNQLTEYAKKSVNNQVAVNLELMGRVKKQMDKFKDNMQQAPKPKETNAKPKKTDEPVQKPKEANAKPKKTVPKLNSLDELVKDYVQNYNLRHDHGLYKDVQKRFDKLKQDEKEQLMIGYGQELSSNIHSPFSNVSNWVQIAESLNSENTVLLKKLEYMKLLRQTDILFAGYMQRPHEELTADTISTILKSKLPEEYIENRVRRLEVANGRLLSHDVLIEDGKALLQPPNATKQDIDDWVAVADNVALPSDGTDKVSKLRQKLLDAARGARDLSA